MPDKAFFDTNILVYAFSEGDPRQEAALSLLLAGGTVSVQSLNEFTNVAIGKLRRPWDVVAARLKTIRQLCGPPIPLTLAVHERGIAIAQTTGYRIYDSMMLAAAMEGSCTIFYSEDLHDGQKLADLTIRNPFKPRR